MSLGRYVSWRVLQLIPLLAAVVVVSFFLLRSVPGDAARVLAGPTATPEYIAHVRAEYGLNQPLLTQFGDYLVQLAHGNLGTSYSISQPVTQIILDRLPATLLLIVSSELLGLLAGAVLGTLTAQRHGSRTDRLISALSLIGTSMPVFWLGMLFILLFSVQLHWLPLSGMYGPFTVHQSLSGVLDLLDHMIMPVLTLTLCWTLPLYLRLTRAGVIAASREDYIRTARAKGASEGCVYFRHALRNARLPLVTMLGLNFSLAVTGAILTETLFSWPGLGLTLDQAIMSRDYPLVMGIFIVTGIGVGVVNLVTDISYAFLDPRVALQ